MMEHEIKQTIERISNDALEIYFDVSADSLTFEEWLKLGRKVNGYRNQLCELYEKHKNNLDLEKEINEIENMIRGINSLKKLIFRKIEYEEI